MFQITDSLCTNIYKLLDALIKLSPELSEDVMRFIRNLLTIDKGNPRSYFLFFRLRNSVSLIMIVNMFVFLSGKPSYY